jgi:hypothetical protein
MITTLTNHLSFTISSGSVYSVAMLLAALLQVKGLQSTYIPWLWVFFPLIGRQCALALTRRGKSANGNDDGNTEDDDGVVDVTESPWFFICHYASLFVPCVITGSYADLLLDFFPPILGRAGDAVPGRFACFLVCFVCLCFCFFLGWLVNLKFLSAYPGTRRRHSAR